jgi:hypothetical protein
MSSEETIITKADLTNPKKIAKKIGKGVILGAGGASQEGLRMLLTKFFPNQNQEFISSLVQFIGMGLLNGYVNNEYADSFLSGVIAGAGKDMFKSAKSLLGKMVSGGVMNSAEAKTIMATSYPQMELQEDAF